MGTYCNLSKGQVSNVQSRITKCLLILLATVFLPISAWAEVINLTPVKDTYVDKSKPTSSYGSSTLLQTKYGSSKARETSLKFNLSGIPQGAQIVSAQLKLHSKNNSSFRKDTATRVYATLGPWSETTTWNTRPPRASSYEYSVAVTTTGQYFKWNITNLVQDWVDGVEANYGVTVRSEGGGELYFNSREASSNRPILYVEYTVPNQPPTLSLEVNPASGTSPLTVTFESNASDTDGSIMEYRWDFDGDGTVDQITTSNPVSVIYDEPGTYNATVEVMDNSGLSASDSVTVNVSPSSTFYISSNGSDSNPGTSAQPWKTFAFAIGQLDPGETLILKNGTYSTSAGTGYPNIDCAAGAKNGTPTQPITIKAENERQAFIQGDGSARPFRIANCSYWTVEGLRAENGDFPNEGGSGVAGTVFLVTDSSDITMKRLLGAKNNRYSNSHIYEVIRSNNILIEESEAYYFHRHGFSILDSEFVTLRRNYANSRGYARIAGGYDGHGGEAANRGDEGLVLYTSDDSIMENNISEGNEYLKTTGSRNQFLGNISIGDIRGIAISHHGTKNHPAVDNIAVNNVSLNAILSNSGLESPDVTIENATSIGSQNSSILANNDQDIDNGGAFQLTPKLTIRNSLSINNTGSGFQVNQSADFVVLVLEYLNSFNNGTNYGVGTAGRTNSQTTNPQLGNCIVYIPAGSPMKGAGKNGADIGANIIFRYKDGELTNEKLWNQTTGQFPCGATVTGVNDDATFPDSSCVNVHKRLNVGVNGCAIP